MVEKCGQGRDLLLHEEHIIQENLANIENISNPFLQNTNCDMVKAIAHQDIGILADVAVRMSLNNALYRSTGV